MELIVYRATFVACFIAIAALAIHKSGSVRSTADFSVAGRSLSASGVAWVIISTLVGGVSTVGTVQTAYDSGIGAGIFTFGSGLSCFLLGLFFAKGLREEGVITVSEYLGRFFGATFRYYASCLNSAGMFIHVVGQFLASIAILQAVFGFGAIGSIGITYCLIGLLVTTGGVAGAGLIGKIKFFMLYLIMLLCAGVALHKGGGWQQLIAGLPAEAKLLSFDSYGYDKALADGFSMLVGVLSTQIYLQAIFSAKNVREARNGAYLAAVLIPPIGVLGIIVGLFLRATVPELEGNSAQALPFFLYENFPPMLAAVFSAGILLIVLGTGAGLVLGVTTNIYNDFLHSRSSLRSNFYQLRLIRLTTLIILAAATILVATGLESTILRWSYMSMGLRGAGVFLGLFILVFCKPLHRLPLVRVAIFAAPALYILISIL